MYIPGHEYFPFLMQASQYGWLTAFWKSECMQRFPRLHRSMGKKTILPSFKSVDTSQFQVFSEIHRRARL